MAGRLLAVLAALGLAGCSAAAPPPDRTVGLFTSLPILWRESAAIGDLLKSDAPPHWARTVLAAHGRLRPLDTLSGKDGKLPLPIDALLVLAQPRALSPQENVALDDWVRAGGHVLLFADPLLTAHSAYALGDRRRPEDMVMLSPILARWGLTLRFDEGQPTVLREIPFVGGVIPVELAGQFETNGNGDCGLDADGVIARCRVGNGRILAIADAALLDEEGDDETAEIRRAMLARLMKGVGSTPDGNVP